jgi:hypothetical protein
MLLVTSLSTVIAYKPYAIQLWSKVFEDVHPFDVFLSMLPMQFVASHKTGRHAL